MGVTLILLNMSTVFSTPTMDVKEQTLRYLTNHLFNKTKYLRFHLSYKIN